LLLSALRKFKRAAFEKFTVVPGAALQARVKEPRSVMDPAAKWPWIVVSQ
jgi:hypothetical protein